MKIRFSDVGRGKWSGEAIIPDTDDPDAIAEAAYGVAKKHLATRFPETTYDQTINKGTIFAGFYTVGHFEVVTEG